MSTSSIMNDTSKEDQLPPGVSAVLRHPSGVDVYIVGVVHMSEKSCEDVAHAILATNPGIVFIELDFDRLFSMVFNRSLSDPYGIKHLYRGFLPLLHNIVLKGNFVPFGVHMSSQMAGALLGGPPGSEFLFAVIAADQVEAKVILGDRSLQATGQRLGQAMSLQVVSDLRKAIGSPSAVSIAPSIEDMTEPKEDSIESDLLKAGCIDPDTVIASFKRIIKQGLLPRGSIDKEDVLIVRDCGQKVLELKRQTALTEGAEHARALEEDALTKVGMDASIAGLQVAAMKVTRLERNLILARGLYEAGEYSGEWPVVGVVGAAHVKGIQEQWSFACTPEAAQQVAGLMEAPSPDLAGSFASKAITGGCIGLLAYRRPRLAAKLLASGVLVTGSTLSLMAVAAHRWQICAERIIEMAQELSPYQASSDDEDLAHRDAWEERWIRVFRSL